MSILESDWKKLRKIEPVALGFACERIHKKLEKQIKTRKGKEHAAYLEVYKLIKTEDKTIARLFNGVKRSRGLGVLAAWKTEGLITEDQFESLSEETQSRVKNLIEIMTA